MKRETYLLRDAYEHYTRCDPRGLNPEHAGNGRFGRSPHDELCDAIEAVIYPQHETCEHGINCGEWCEPCNREYKLARAENDDEPERYSS